MVSPGGNAGGKARAGATVKVLVSKLLEIASDFEIGSKEFNAVMGAIKTLNPIFSKPTEQDTGGAARRQLAEAPKPPLGGSAPPLPMGGAPTPPPMGQATGIGGQPEM